MDLLPNLDLLSVGIAIAATLVLGFSVYFSNKKSASCRTFLIFSLITAIWGILNYASYRISNPHLAFWFLRTEVFFGMWHSLAIFQFLYVFPLEKKVFPNWYKFILLPVVSVMSLTTFTPLIFSGVKTLSVSGHIVTLNPGPLLPVFGLLVIGLVVSSLLVLFNKIRLATKEEHIKFRLLLLGAIVTFFLILALNFILPAFFDNPYFIPYGAIFTLPFIAFTSYAIIRHGLLNIKVITTEILTFILAVVTFSEIVFSNSIGQIIFRSSVFVLVLMFGILLIKSVRREVEQREKIEILAKELTLANDKLRELDKQKTEFLSIASHQLRAPLTAIKGYSSLLLEKSFGEISDKVRGAVEVIFQSSQKLVAVIEDFLNITRIELGKMKYEMATVDLKQLVETAVKELQNQIAAKGLALKVDIPAGLDWRVEADAGKIAQVIGNLIDNATKYTKDGGITISLSKPLGARKVRLTIADTGVGMTPGAHAQLFQKFTRAKDAGKVNIIGTGLGLYVAKQIVEAHGGKIWAESPGPGRGSTFYVEI